ncbi:MAG: hypothetical protein ACHBN1_31280 [Heteroscytonema crispum UTEX LB 1556]
MGRPQDRSGSPFTTAVHGFPAAFATGVARPGNRSAKLFKTAIGHEGTRLMADFFAHALCSEAYTPAFPHFIQNPLHPETYASQKSAVRFLTLDLRAGSGGQLTTDKGLLEKIKNRKAKNRKLYYAATFSRT